jgi:hypothetical protein
LTREVEANPTDFPRPRQIKEAVVLDGRFRGQRLRSAVPVTFHPVPEKAALQYPLPTRGKVAVFADAGLVSRYGEGGGALAVVLDASGSMAAGTARGSEGPAVTKYKEATDALRQVFGKVSRGTVVSLWLFGQAVPPNNDAPDAERTITQVLAPRPWDPQDPSLVDEVMKRVESPAVTPWNGSPIVRTMLQARGDLDHAGPGPKSLLVLTDGMDNRFARDAEANPARKDIPTAIRDAFVDSDIEILVVGYKISDAEEVEARAQFKVIEELPRPGRFFSVRDAGLLARTLALALRPTLRATVETLGNVPIQGLTVGRPGENPRWSEPGLEPGGYKLVARAGARRERELVLNRGDLLMVRLSERAGVAIDRELYSGDATPRDRQERVSGWRLAVVRNARTGRERDGLDLWSTLEKLPSPRESALEMIKPREFWVEVAAANAAADTPFSQRWSYRVGLPAPCWSLRVAAWPAAEGDAAPGTSRPTITAWWDPDQEAAYTSAVVRLADFDSTEEIPAREVRAEGSTVAIESVAVEEARAVEVAPGDRRVRSCLVVRLRHEPGKPFFVRPLGLRPEGAEHRFYEKANKYTGIFWNVTRDQASVALTGLGLVSLEDFKARAERRGYRATWQSPGAPDPRATGPALVPFDEPGPEPLGPGE